MFCSIGITQYLEKWMSKVAGSRIPPSKQFETLDTHYLEYFISCRTCCRVSRNMHAISYHERRGKFVRSIISFQLLSLCDCASLFMIFCVLAFTGSRGETIQWRSFSFVLSHVQLHMRVFLVCNLVAITRLNSIFDEKDDDDGHPSYKPFCGCYMLFTACVKLPSS